MGYHLRKSRAGEEHTLASGAPTGSADSRCCPLPLTGLRRLGARGGEGSTFTVHPFVAFRF